MGKTRWALLLRGLRAAIANHAHDFLSRNGRPLHEPSLLSKLDEVTCEMAENSDWHAADSQAEPNADRVGRGRTARPIPRCSRGSSRRSGGGTVRRRLWRWVRRDASRVAQLASSCVCSIRNLHVTSNPKGNVNCAISFNSRFRVPSSPRLMQAGPP